MKAATQHRIRLGSRRIDYQIVRSKAATQLRVRVGPNGVEVVKPAMRNGEEVPAFLRVNEAWILEQLERVQRLPGIVQPGQRRIGEILFRGEPTRVRIVEANTRARANSIALDDGEIVIRRGCSSRTPITRSLERWFRRRAREKLIQHLARSRQASGTNPAGCTSWVSAPSGQLLGEGQPLLQLAAHPGAGFGAPLHRHSRDRPHCNDAFTANQEVAV